MATGIVDATKVVRLAVQDAVSIASLLVTTEVVIADKPEPEPPAGAGAKIPWVAWAVWVEWVCLEWAAWAVWVCLG